MGKVKRLRQKYHTSIAKEERNEVDNGGFTAPGPLQLVPTVKNTIPGATSSSGSNMFAGLQIKLGEVENTPTSSSIDVSDVTSTASFRKQNKCGTKKERRRQKHEEFMQQIDFIQGAARAERERKKREKTAVVGDMHPLLNALPSLKELMSASKTKTQPTKGVSGKKKMEMQKDFMSDIQMFMAVHQDPIFKSDPFGAVRKAVENRVLYDKEDS